MEDGWTDRKLRLDFFLRYECCFYLFVLFVEGVQAGMGKMAWIYANALISLCVIATLMAPSLSCRWYLSV